jgi:hypothetical protein
MIKYNYLHSNIISLIKIYLINRAKNNSIYTPNLFNNFRIILRVFKNNQSGYVEDKIKFCFLNRIQIFYYLKI